MPTPTCSACRKRAAPALRRAEGSGAGRGEQASDAASRITAARCCGSMSPRPCAARSTTASSGSPPSPPAIRVHPRGRLDPIKGSSSRTTGKARDPQPTEWTPSSRRSRADPERVQHDQRTRTSKGDWDDTSVPGATTREPGPVDAAREIAAVISEAHTFGSRRVPAIGDLPVRARSSTVRTQSSTLRHQRRNAPASSPTRAVIVVSTLLPDPDAGEQELRASAPGLRTSQLPSTGSCDDSRRARRGHPLRPWQRPVRGPAHPQSAFHWNSSWGFVWDDLPRGHRAGTLTMPPRWGWDVLAPRGGKLLASFGDDVTVEGHLQRAPRRLRMQDGPVGR